MHDITFSPCLPEDADTIFALERELIDRFEDFTSLDRDAVLAWVYRKLSARIGEYTRILLRGSVVGYYSLTSAGESRELDSFYILPAYRNLGIGTEVLTRLCADGALFLYCFTENPARRLYERLGFTLKETVSPTRIILQRTANNETGP